MDARAARDRWAALSFRREVAAQQPALAELFRERRPAIRGGAESIEVRQLGVIHSVNWLGVEIALRVLLRLSSVQVTRIRAARCLQNRPLPAGTGRRFRTTPDFLAVNSPLAVLLEKHVLAAIIDDEHLFGLDDNSLRDGASMLVTGS